MKPNDPAALGVPEMVQEPLRFRPVGKPPADREQTSGAVPPDVARVPLYRTPTVPLAIEVVVIVGAALTVSVIACADPDTPMLSVGVTFTVELPAAATVPVTVQPELTVKPDPERPLSAEHVTAPVPPEIEIEAE